jgi:hypothetical protein
MKKWSLIAAGVSALTLTPAAQAVTIQFDYSLDANNFFANATARNLLETAGSVLGSRLGDSLTAITSAGFNSFDAVFNSPWNNASTTLNDYGVAADTLTVFVGGSNLLPSGVLGQGGPGGYSASGTQSFLDNVAGRGQAAATQGAGATDFAPWGGSISFNAGSAWYFDADPTTRESFGNSLNDFYSVALHELGHVLGFGTADSWDHWISAGVFTGPAAAATHGGAVTLFSDGAHWAEGTVGLADGLSQEAAMDPNLTQGTRKVFTDLDMAALSDVGWQITPVPVPGAVWLLGSGLLVLARQRQLSGRG